MGFMYAVGAALVAGGALMLLLGMDSPSNRALAGTRLELVVLRSELAMVQKSMEAMQSESVKQAAEGLTALSDDARLY